MNEDPTSSISRKNLPTTPKTKIHGIRSVKLDEGSHAKACARATYDRAQSELSLPPTTRPDSGTTTPQATIGLGGILGVDGCWE